LLATGLLIFIDDLCWIENLTKYYNWSKFMITYIE